VKDYAHIASNMFGKSVILYCNDTFCFCIGFFAILAANKELIVPAYLHTTTTAELDCENIFTDKADLHTQAIIIEPNRKTASTDEINISAEAKIYFYTSGSTGTPKKIAKRFQNMIDETAWLTKLLGDIISQKLVFLATVNINHMYGVFYHFLVPFCNAAIIDTSLISTPEQLAEKLDKYAAAFLSSSPAFLSRVARNKDIYSFAATTKAIVTAGGPLDRVTAAACEVMLGVWPLEIYGSTESGGIAWKHRSDVWTLDEPVKAQINAGGYLVISEGFVDDICEMADMVEFEHGSDKRFVLKGRGDRLTKFEEKRVSLAELEQLLCSSELVHSAYASHDTQLGFVGVCVSLSDLGKRHLLNNGKNQLVAQLKRLLRTRIDPVCIPSRWRFLDELPTNAQGKILSSKIASILSTNVAEPIVLSKSIQENSFTMQLQFLADANYFKGHFSEMPLLAGVVQIHFVIYWIQWYISNVVNSANIKRMKFNHMIFPDDIVTLSVSKTGRGFEYKYTKDDVVCSSGIIAEPVTQPVGFINA
jgi:3-hydroxymyristoyl/3-hydroxydecanoyl-(acyl carrier protein) dehydratase